MRISEKPVMPAEASVLIGPADIAFTRTLRGPTIAVSCEKTELSEYAIACARLIGPSASPS